MTELDKKLQKTSPDLVQSVLEAMEKRNLDRVDVLITNAFKQLKMSRFKPDPATCNGLTYLARICPKVFSQSASLKELLKTQIKRDGAPTNIKGTKNDFILPVLAANILLACCDTTDVRSIILTRIEQWISSNQRLNELVQHLLATLCIRCNDDSQTIKTLIDMRSHWYQFLDVNFETYGSVSRDLSRSIRNLVSNIISCEALIENLQFLMKHDSDILGLATSISKLIVRKPITIESMLDQTDSGDQLKQILISLYDKLFEQMKPIIKSDERDELESPVFVRISDQEGDVLALDRSIIEALLILVSSPKMTKHIEAQGPAVRWLFQINNSSHGLAYVDKGLGQPIEFSTRLLQRLIKSDELQVSLAINCVRPIQILELISSFGLDVRTLKKLFSRIDEVNADDIARSGLRDLPYFNELFEYYNEIGIDEARRLVDRTSNPQDVKDIERKPETVIVKIKDEPL